MKLSELLEKKKETDPSLKPPKEWFDKMEAKIKKDNPDYDEERIGATVGSIWYKKMSKKERKKTREAEEKKYGKAPVNEANRYSDDYQTGFDEGYEKGYDDGHRAGYEEGQRDSEITREFD